MLRHLSSADQATVRRVMIDLVLATDISRHFTFLSHFNAKVRCRPLSSSARNLR